MKNKAQIKFGETIGVIIIVTIIIFAGITWYNNINQKDILELQEKDDMKRSFEKYYYIINLNLIRVNEFGSTDDEYDINSMRVFANFTKDGNGKEFVRKRLDESLVKVEIFNSQMKSIENITLYNMSPNTKLNEYTREVYRSLIPIKDTGNNSFYIGIIEVTTYQKY